jgi:hypothetical protein
MIPIEGEGWQERGMTWQRFLCAMGLHDWAQPAMVLSLGRQRSKLELAQNIKRITPEIIEVDCPECGGDGDWGKFFKVDGFPSEDWACVQCKGTGRVSA